MTPIQLDSAAAALLKATSRAVLLGIITKAGQVLLAESSPSRRPGHMEWIAADGIADAARGFALLVTQGDVAAIFPLSRLNPAQDGRLEREILQRLLELLECSAECQVLE